MSLYTCIQLYMFFCCWVLQSSVQLYQIGWQKRSHVFFILSGNDSSLVYISDDARRVSVISR
jgi:hypothetical protein